MRSLTKHCQKDWRHLSSIQFVKWVRIENFLQTCADLFSRLFTVLMKLRKVSCWCFVVVYPRLVQSVVLYIVNLICVILLTPGYIFSCWYAQLKICCIGSQFVFLANIFNIEKHSRHLIVKICSSFYFILVQRCLLIYFSQVYCLILFIDYWRENSSPWRSKRMSSWWSKYSEVSVLKTCWEVFSTCRLH